MAKEKRLKIGAGFELRCSANSPLGEVISYLQKLPLNNLEIARGTLIARFLPFTLDLSKPEHRATALACAIECESWGRAIREYCALPCLSSVTTTSASLTESRCEAMPSGLSPEARLFVETERESESSEEDKLEKFRQKLQSVVAGSSSSLNAKERLIELQPERDDSWSEAQWELWEEFTTKQEAEIQKQLLGDWVS